MIRRPNSGLSRRSLLACAAAAGLTPLVAGAGKPPRGLRWVAGDHHVHTKYSGSADAPYRIEQHVERAAGFGLGWLVVTDHPGPAHRSHGLARSLDDLRRARADHPDMQLFQGIEWRVPAGEHATLFTAPGPHEASLLADFEARFDTGLNDSVGSGAAGQAEAVRALDWLSAQVRAGLAPMALCILNHPSRAGTYGPAELRALRDAGAIVIGMEGAPGGQANGIPAADGGVGGDRGSYGRGPFATSYRGYPDEAYRTYGGFDWLTATVGGMWDAMLAEGLPWWITASSDAHKVFGERWRSGGPPGADGSYPDPVIDPSPGAAGGFWPGQYSRTHVGVTGGGPLAVMRALRDGRVWVDHGHLVDAVAVSVGSATLGEVATVDRGDGIDADITVTLASRDNANGDRPRLRRVDVIAGPVTGRAAPDARTAPGTRVVGSYDVDEAGGTVTLRHRFGDVREPFYVRLRGTDGNVSARDSIEPRPDPSGDADPWRDLWFYTNPVFVDVS
ncbi:histidinol-phosphatase [Catellatospora methionotrophica]|uniref:Histidinol-phosphatase n=1 Tax=Catellatospora methionotrophica TaxID=121620 RepID=A0A8J3L9L9_9ACTN|nr:PHP domain-containing protein [Catellatospora methionotrophica]GIG14977.1 histidinol-phosphatase [Catellatospora methionotrophica]